MMDYLALPNVPVVGGTWLVTPRALVGNDRQDVVLKLEQLRQLLAPIG
jgi:2-dehydro-3-deoxyphosphogluconate aldolase/(4S)-4-hydroxy-2-oxoglutarate aldolase